MAEGTTINIYGGVTGGNVMIGSHNQLNAAQFADVAPLPVFDADAPVPAPSDLPAGSRLPFPRNPLFTGREAELAAIARSLLGEQTGAVINQAVTGMGGMGKTQLAVEFGYRYGQFFRGVHWLNMASPESINSEIASCGMQMGLPNFPDDLPSQVVLTLNVWREYGPRLLILDNFEAVELVNQVMKHFNHSNLRVLLTSRHSDWSPTMGLNPIPLDVFSAEESLAFLRKWQAKRRDTDGELSLLAVRLGHLPLALELAARYLHGHPRLDVAGYLEQASRALEHPSMQNWREDLPAPTGHDLSLLNTFALSWQELTDGVKSRETFDDQQSAQRRDAKRLEASMETVQNIFLISGYLAPNEPIPLEIFEGTLDISLDACDEATQRLMGLGLLQHEENGLPSIHPLLAEYARTLGKDGKLLESTAGVVFTLTTKAGETGIPTDFVLLKAHTQTLAESVEKAGLEDAGSLWNNYGYYLDMIADYLGARVAYEHAIKIGKEVFGPDNPKVAIYTNNLGNVLRKLGDLDRSKVIFEHAIKILESSLGKNHPHVAVVVNNLGGVLEDMDDLKGACATYKRALKIDEAELGTEHPNTARDVNNLGLALKRLGNLSRALAAFKRALKIFEKQLGEHHPDVATTVNNLGMVLKDQGNLGAARQTLERALKIDEEIYGLCHPNVARDINNLGLVMQDLGDLEGARANLERALAILKKFLPPEHPNIKTVQKNLEALDK